MSGNGNKDTVLVFSFLFPSVSFFSGLSIDPYFCHTNKSPLLYTQKTSNIEMLLTLKISHESKDTNTQAFQSSRYFQWREISRDYTHTDVGAKTGSLKLFLEFIKEEDKHRVYLLPRNFQKTQLTKITFIRARNVPSLFLVYQRVCFQLAVLGNHDGYYVYVTALLLFVKISNL